MSSSGARRRAAGPVVRVDKAAGEPLGVEVSSAVFDRVRTCDNHCAFCFIYQLPKGMRRSLYLKDDDYRLSFLYGNFTTLTRFTELDVERVLTERLGPLFVSIHATDPDVRAAMLRNPKGATSLRWLGCCSTAASRCTARSWSARGSTTARCSRTPWPASSTATPTLATRGRRAARAEPLLERADACARTRTTRRCAVRRDRRGVAGSLRAGARAGGWSTPPTSTTSWPGASLPPARHYEGYPQHENGIGMARAFAEAFARPGADAPAASARLLRLGRRRPRRAATGRRACPRPRPAGTSGRSPS